MSLEGLRKELAQAQGAANGARTPIGGRYIALLRRTATGVLFSDPIHVADGQALPDLPEGVEYVVVHPFSAPAKAHTLAEHLPPNALDKSAWFTAEPKQAALPALQDHGLFSSFLPACDSSLTSLRAADYAALNGSGSGSGELEAELRVTEAEVASAMELAQRALSDGPRGDGEAEISPEVLRDLGLTLADVGMDVVAEPEPEPATAEEILAQNNALLARLLEMQDQRARSGDYGAVSAEERAVAGRLQASLARAAGASVPRDLRPASSEIQRAAKLLLAGTRPSYAGTLPPQRRFAFMSNVAGASVPPSATAAPMQRPPPPRQP
ncbi:hypothetical protein IWQ57_000243 [Coemansia nantahalensis]|uniref:Uncharacterized protein n=1 Tax=Coemansia nantahalensis TaxID=2789366 RepID=A0ACC1K8R4_9FUNG|nr:hypothetical protein IWQ57_000243 [Coemansia nantahalensis]